MKKYLSQGFTLVELLIVIALLGVIATIVIAAINPIEQANRAADAGMKADASQIVSAVERYYTSHSVFPWNAATCSGSSSCLNGPAQGPDTALPFVSVDDLAIGICGASGASCKTTATEGELISSLELQKTFLSKSWVGAISAQSKLWVGKAGSASSAIYVCWSPKANSNRQVLITSSLSGNSNKMFDVTTGFTLSGLPTAGGCTKVSDVGWTTGACVECVPE